MMDDNVKYSDGHLELSYPPTWQIVPDYYGSSFTVIRNHEVNSPDSKASITVQHYYNVHIALSDIIDNTVVELRQYLESLIIEVKDKENGILKYSGKVNGTQMAFHQIICMTKDKNGNNCISSITAGWTSASSGDVACEILRILETICFSE